MAKLFGNLNLVLLLGLVLSAVVILAFGNLPGGAAGLNQIFRWFHVFFGVLWIGLLYYLNFVQVPTMPKVPAELKPGVTKYIAPTVLFYFRWAALFTVITGLIVAHLTGYLSLALTFQPGYQLIGIGMWLALIMAFNVWFIIWPNQKKVLGIVAADDAAKAKATTTALIASRTNTMLSLPMLFAMVAANLG